MKAFLAALFTFLVLSSVVFAQTPNIKQGDNFLFALVDENGNQLTEYKYNMINKFNEGYAAVNYQEKWGFVDVNGKEVIKPKYYEVQFFSEGLCAVSKRKWYFIDKDGKKAIRKKFDYAFSFSEGLAAVKKDGLWGFINKQGDWVIPALYESAYNFSEGLAAVKKKEKWGYINRMGQKVIPFRFEQAYFFKNGIAQVMYKEKLVEINKRGQPIKPKEEEKEEKTAEKVYTLVEKMPSYPGGYDKLFEYLEENKKYPEEEKERGIGGEVLLMFTVSKTGKIKDIRILDGLTRNFDVEAMRLISEMPDWIPGELEGEKVNVRIKMTIEFEAEGP